MANRFDVIKNKTTAEQASDVKTGTPVPEAVQAPDGVPAPAAPAPRPSKVKQERPAATGERPAGESAEQAQAREAMEAVIKRQAESTTPLPQDRAAAWMADQKTTQASMFPDLAPDVITEVPKPAPVASVTERAVEAMTTLGGAAPVVEANAVPVKDEPTRESVSAKTDTAPVVDTAPEPVVAAAQAVEDVRPLDGPMSDGSHPLDTTGQILKSIGKFAEKQLSKVRLYPSLARQRKSTEGQLKVLEKGSAVSAPLTGDFRVGIHEISVSAELMWKAYQEPTSALRTLMDGYTDDATMADPALGSEAILNFFNDDNNPTEALCEKSPAVNEGSAHLRRIKVHMGPDVRINPLVNVMWNADFDGDAMKISFNERARVGAKRAIDFLVGTEGEAKIDTKFFHLANWEEVSTRAMLTKMFPDLELTTEEIAGLGEAIFTTGQGNGQGFRSILRWTRVIGDRVGANDLAKREQTMSHILMSLYDMNRNIVLAKLQIEGVWNTLGMPTFTEGQAGEAGPGPTAPGTPANLADMGVAQGGPIGATEGANDPFRAFANNAKMGRELADLFGGDTQALIAEHLVAAQISGIASLDDRHQAMSAFASRLCAESLAERTGRPYPVFDTKTSPKDALDEFAEEWNKAAFIVRSATFLMYQDTSVKFDPSDSVPFIETGPLAERNEAIRSRFVAVYGHVSMNALFGKSLPNALRLSEWVHLNTYDNKRLGTPSTKFDTTEAFIGRLADMRTSFARTFEVLLLGTEKKGVRTGGTLAKQINAKTGKMKLLELIERRETEGVNIDQDIAVLTEALYLIGEDAFYHFGLDNPNAFYASELGQKLLNSTTTDELGGVLIELLTRYRFDKVRNLEGKMRAAKSNSLASKLQIQIKAELAKIASSSPTWATVVKAYGATDSRVFDQILLADIGLDAKVYMLNQMVRDLQIGTRPGHQHFEVLADLYANPRGTHAANRFMTDLGRSELKKKMYRSQELVSDAAKEGLDACRKAVKKAKTKHGVKGLEDFLAKVLADPSLLVEIPRWSIADGIIGVLTKTYGSSEKNQQEDQTNYLYSSVGELVNGGIWADMTVAGDFALGGMSLRSFQSSPHWIAKVLTDPEFSVFVYDEDGRGRTLSQADLVPDGDYWAFFERNPRVAMAFRIRARENFVSDTGSSPLTATTSLVNSMSKVLNEGQPTTDLIMKKLVNHPGFHALVSLTAPAQGRNPMQLRKKLTDNVEEVINLLRGLGEHRGDMRGFVQQMYEASGMEYYGKVYTWEHVDKMYKDGLEQEREGATVLGEGKDVRDTFEFQLGQVLNELTHALESYHDIVVDLGLDDGAPADPVDAAKLFALYDTSTLRMQQDVIQVFGGAKTQLSTSYNGGITRLMWASQLINRHEIEDCGAPPTELTMDTAAFEDTGWEDHEGRQAILPTGELVTIGETTVADIVARSGEQVLIEDPAMCLSPLCACSRHATGDPSTNMRVKNTPALGRMILIVRMLSTEALNLKWKKTGNDGKDSISKMEVSIKDVQDEIGSVYGEEKNLPAARRRLAEILHGAFAELGYKNELSLDDFTNVAQLLVRETPDGVMVLQFGRLNAIMSSGVFKARLAGQLDMAGAVAAAANALTEGKYLEELDQATILASIRVPSEAAYFDSRIPYQRVSSKGRSVAVTRQIAETAWKAGVQVQTDAQLDARERQVKSNNHKLLRWYDGKSAKFLGGKRYSHRILDVITEEKGFEAEAEAIGAMNAWIIDGPNSNAAAAIVRAYELGLTVIIKGSVYDLEGETAWGEVWTEVQESLPEMDQNQAVQYADDQWILPMFDIQLNGGNTEFRNGTINAGEFKFGPEKVTLIAETVGFGLGDSLFQACKSFVESVVFGKTGEYAISLRQAFGSSVDLIGRNVVPEIVEPGEIAALIDWVNDEQREAPQLDMGFDIKADPIEEQRFAAAWATFLTRIDEIDPKTNMLPDAIPGEIVGFLKVKGPDGPIYHPIRIFERGQESGAPERVEITGSLYDLATSELRLGWDFSGNMEGRTFKIFEWLAAANKFMARSETVPDIVLQNGLKLAGYIAKASTASRRLTMRRSQKMMTLFFLARMKPFGYNLAEVERILPGNDVLRERLASGDALIGEWKDALQYDSDAATRQELAFFPDETDALLNAFCNLIARRAIDYNINPTNVFASHFGPDQVSSNIWFNFQYLWGDLKGPVFQELLMTLFHRMMPRLCPPGLEDTGDTLFNKDLQMMIPLEYKDLDGKDVKGQQWVDIFAGFHFFDEHFTGYSNSGATVASDGYSMKATLLGAGYGDLMPHELDQLMGWGSNVDPSILGRYEWNAFRVDDGLEEK